ncbi:MAG: hypothetical protein RLZZ440_766, partial [Planctomycetota bacterium]
SPDNAPPLGLAADGPSAARRAASSHLCRGDRRVLIDHRDKGPVDGIRGPVLVLADNQAIATAAVRWAAEFAAIGVVHRVRLVEHGDAQELASVLAEAGQLGAAAIAAGGAGPQRAVALAISERLGLPLVAIEP